MNCWDINRLSTNSQSRNLSERAVFASDANYCLRNTGILNDAGRSVIGQIDATFMTEVRIFNLIALVY